jgi:hypothetical protein
MASYRRANLRSSKHSSSRYKCRLLHNHLSPDRLGHGSAGEGGDSIIPPYIQSTVSVIKLSKPGGNYMYHQVQQHSTFCRAHSRFVTNRSDWKHTHRLTFVTGGVCFLWRTNWIFMNDTDASPHPPFPNWNISHRKFLRLSLSPPPP